MDEADARRGFGFEDGLFVVVGGVRGGGAAVGEVVGGGDAALEVIEAAEKGEPVLVVGGGFRGVGGVEVVDPAVKGLVGGEAAVGGLPEVGVGGDEAGEDVVAVGVDRGGGVERGGWVAGGDGEDGAVGRDGDVAVDGWALGVDGAGHGHDVGVGDEEPRGRGLGAGGDGEGEERERRAEA